MQKTNIKKYKSETILALWYRDAPIFKNSWYRMATRRVEVPSSNSSFLHSIVHVFIHPVCALSTSFQGFQGIFDRPDCMLSKYPMILCIYEPASKWIAYAWYKSVSYRFWMFSGALSLYSVLFKSTQNNAKMERNWRYLSTFLDSLWLFPKQGILLQSTPNYKDSN
jgi:hypothetical protein